MNFLEERIVKDGIVKEGNVLKVDSFLNHQMDIRLFEQIGAEFKRRFEGKDITKILTIEASGIGIACIAARYFDVPVVFASTSRAMYMWQRWSLLPTSAQIRSLFQKNIFPPKIKFSSLTISSQTAAPSRDLSLS